jgi:hypothetical protein
MLTIVLAESELELIPNQIIFHPAVSSYAKQRNKKQNAIDYSTDCFYKRCQYKCIGFTTDPDAAALPIDDTTYNLYYVDDFLQKTIIMIQKIFL